MTNGNGSTKGEASFWHSVAVVLTGTAAAQAIPILGSLVLARLFLPADFGVFATWLGLTAVGAVVVTGRYEMALALEPDGDFRRRGAVATLVVVALATLAGAVLLAGVYGLVRALEPHGRLVALFAPAVGVIAVFQTWQSWAAAEGRFHDLSVIRIGQALGVTGLQIAAGLVAPTALSLAAAQVLGTLLGVAIAAWKMPLRLARPEQHASWRPAIADYLRRHRRFPLYSLAADTVSTSAAQLPLVIVNARFGAHEAGLLAIVMRVLGAPVSLLAASVLDVFRRRAATSWRERGDCRADYMHTFRVLALGSAAAGVVFGIFSEQLFAIAFGEPWRMAGTIALWLLPMFLLRFVASPLSYVFYVTGKQQVDLAWQMALFVTVLSSLSLPEGFRAALVTYSVGYSLLYVVYLGLSYRFSGGARAS